MKIVKTKFEKLKFAEDPRARGPHPLLVAIKNLKKPDDAIRYKSDQPDAKKAMNNVRAKLSYWKKKNLIPVEIQCAFEKKGWIAVFRMATRLNGVAPQ